MTVEQINDDEFNQKVLEGSKDKPVLVAFGLSGVVHVRL